MRFRSTASAPRAMRGWVAGPASRASLFRRTSGCAGGTHPAVAMATRSFSRSRCHASLQCPLGHPIRRQFCRHAAKRGRTHSPRQAGSAPERQCCRRLGPPMPRTGYYRADAGAISVTAITVPPEGRPCSSRVRRASLALNSPTAFPLSRSPEPAPVLSPERVSGRAALRAR